MADITNPQAVKFSNEMGRTLARAILAAYKTARDVAEYYYAHPELGEVFTAGIADTVVDGSQTDGRPVMIGNDVLAVVTRATELTADLEANNNAKLNTLLRCTLDGDSQV